MYRCPNPVKKRRHRYKDFTNDPNFKSHTDYAERMRKEFKRAEEIRIETDKREAEQGRKLILTLIATISAGYLTTLIYQLTNHQIGDKNRSIVGQIGTVRIKYTHTGPCIYKDGREKNGPYFFRKCFVRKTKRAKSSF